MRKTKIAIFGCGFWSQFQIGGWLELSDAEVVALYNRTPEKAIQKSEMFGIKKVYSDAEELLRNEEVDVVDIITDVDTHYQFVDLAAKYKKDVIVQKPMAADFSTAKKMMALTSEAGVRYYVHENYRWQLQFRRVKEIIDSGEIGKVFLCRTAFKTAFPVFETQPFLAQLTHFALTDQGSHQFDVLRFLFGEAESIYCIAQSIIPGIKGEDVAISMVKMKSGVTCIQEISFSSKLEREVFPQTLLIAEGTNGSLRIDPDFEIVITNNKGSRKETVKMNKFWWQTDRLLPEPDSIIGCNRDILNDLRGKSKAETTGADNFETVRLVWAAYESASTNQVVRISND